MLGREARAHTDTHVVADAIEHVHAPTMLPRRHCTQDRRVRLCQCPGLHAGLEAMHDAELRDTARAATNRKGLLRLLSLLGFAGPYIPAPRYALPMRARVCELSRGALLVSVVELRTHSDAYTCRHIAHALRTARPASHHFIAVLAP